MDNLPAFVCAHEDVGAASFSVALLAVNNSRPGESVAAYGGLVLHQHPRQFVDEVSLVAYCKECCHDRCTDLIAPLVRSVREPEGSVPVYLRQNPLDIVRVVGRLIAPHHSREFIDEALPVEDIHPHTLAQALRITRTHVVTTESSGSWVVGIRVSRDAKCLTTREFACREAFCVSKIQAEPSPTYARATVVQLPRWTRSARGTP